MSVAIAQLGDRVEVHRSEVDLDDPCQLTCTLTGQPRTSAIAAATNSGWPGGVGVCAGFGAISADPPAEFVTLDVASAALLACTADATAVAPGSRAMRAGDPARPCWPRRRHDRDRPAAGAVR